MFGRKKSGFTLIELLVVIAIIAILAAILFPVFAKAKEQARKSTCQSNLKECIIALQTYYTDFDSMFPSSWISFVSDGNSNTTATVPDQAHEELFCFGYDSGNTGKDVLPPLGGDIMVTWAQMLYNNMRARTLCSAPLTKLTVRLSQLTPPIMTRMPHRAKAYLTGGSGPRIRLGTTPTFTPRRKAIILTTPTTSFFMSTLDGTLATRPAFASALRSTLLTLTATFAQLPSSMLKPTDYTLSTRRMWREIPLHQHIRTTTKTIP